MILIILKNSFNRRQDQTQYLVIAASVVSIIVPRFFVNIFNEELFELTALAFNDLES
jgi:hypothetical protein